MKFARTEEDIKSCFGVMTELRPHLQEAEFIIRVKRMSKNGYCLVYLTRNNQMVSVAGIKISEWLHTGKYLEIEDFITRIEYRSQGVGGELFEAIKTYAKENSCIQVRLVSGVKREEAHKFYLENGMSYEAKYFSINI